MYGAEHLLRLFVKLPFILSQYDGKYAKVDLKLDNSNEWNACTDACMHALSSPFPVPSSALPLFCSSFLPLFLVGACFGQRGGV